MLETTIKGHRGRRLDKEREGTSEPGSEMGGRAGGQNCLWWGRNKKGGSRETRCEVFSLEMGEPDQDL